VRSVGQPRAWDPEVIDQAIPPLEDFNELAPVNRNGDDPPVTLGPSDMKAWTGERFTSKANGNLDRSDTLYWIGCAVARGLVSTDLSEAAKLNVIEQAIANRDHALGYNKYAGRGDSAAQYATIAHKALQDVTSQPDVRISKNGSKDQAQAEQKSPFGGQGPGVTKLLADAILEDAHFAQDAGGKLYRFSGGAYRQHAERYVRRRVKEILEGQASSDKWSSHRANEVVEYIRADAPELWEKPPTDRVNVANGILHLKSRKLQSHTPDYLSSVQLPVEYDPAAECPAWDKFIAETFPHDAHQLAWEIAADLMTPERSRQKSLLLLGEGSNGKSTALRAYCAFVGSTNVTGLSLQKMEGDRFSVARLVGKLANVCPDLPSTHLTETSVFKALTGGDLVNAEYKYRESFEFPPFARLIFSANHAPRSSDASHAFFRRWLVIPFERTFEESEQIPREELDAQLSDPRELSGVLNKALEVLPKLRREGFTESESMRDAWEEFRQMTDPLAVWLENFTVEHPAAFVAKRDLLSEYNAHCERSGRAGMTNQAFGRAFRRLKPHIEHGQREVNGKPKTWVWLGLGLRRTETDPPDGGVESRDSRDSRDSSNCFGNGPVASEEAGGEVEVTNKGKRVNHVKGVNAAAGLSAADVLQTLEDPSTGAHKNALLYSAGETALEYLVRSVLFSKGISTEEWQQYAGVVEEAFEEWRKRGS
jgi:P4 family phage/plasmid primase-like protien